MKTFCISGCSGFIGYNLSQELLKQGYTVIGIDINPTRYQISHWNKLKENPNFIGIEKDICKITKFDIFEQALTQLKTITIDGIFHLAALARVQYSIENPIETTNTNIIGTINLLELCKEMKIKRFVFSSSSSIYGDQKIFKEDVIPRPMSHYAAQKLSCEFFCKICYDLFGIETISLRYFNVVGPEQDVNGDYANLVPKFINKALNNEDLPIWGDGETKRDFTSVYDVVRANILAMNTNEQKCFGNVFNIGSGENYSVNEITQMILNLTESKSKPFHLPAVKGEPRNTLADITKAKKLLKWIPKDNLENVLKKQIEQITT